MQNYTGPSIRPHTSSLLRVGAAIGFVSTLATLAPATAYGFSTRIHILLANRLRQALIEKGDGSIPLVHSPHSVRLSAEDVQALTDHPLQFRAGAIGPDNLVFPGMTDPSHALHQKPYEQCEILYKLALLPEERAYAMGCFLHGATDAIAHHYVNYMTGETFTLTPISKGRQSGYDNVVRHMLAENLLQKAAVAKDPDGFRIGQMAHSIPKSFLLRAYFDEQSPLWQLMARHAKEKFDAAQAKNPTASLPTLVAGLDIGPADHMALAPVYLRNVDDQRVKLRSDIVSSIAAMQNVATADGAQLRVQAGADGKLGTSDDKTACSATCPTLYAKYFTYVALLAPRKDAMGMALPSAFDKISDKLREDLFKFMPAYLQTIEGLSSKLNAPPTATTASLDITPAEITALFMPMTTWANNLTTVDYETVIRSVVPDWLISLQDALRAVGVNVSISGIVEALFQPVIRPIKDAIKAQAIDRATKFLTELVDEEKRTVTAITAEYERRFGELAGEGLPGKLFDHLFDMGLYSHSYNIAAASLSSHAVVLPIGEDPVGIGPASFDASYTPAWMQASLCGYLKTAIFPLGADLKGLLTVRLAGKDYVARVNTDSPVECHDGSLSMFAPSPTVQSCGLTDIKQLLSSKVGSLSRAFPPTLGKTQPTCQNLTVPGLPAPPVAPDLGTPPSDLGTEPPKMDQPGCACNVGNTPAAPQKGALGLIGLGVLGLWGLRSGLRRRLRKAALAAAFLASGCGPAEPGAMDVDGGFDMAPSDMMGAADMQQEPVDFGMTPKGKLLAALGKSVWSGKQMRNGKERAYELRFDATSLLWAEIQNPYGPARRRELRVFVPDADGTTVATTVTSPVEWPDAMDIGRKDTWTLTVIPGTPRRLKTQRNGVTEEFTEGAYPAPSSGLTATARSFAANGRADKAFCSSGAGGFDYNIIFDFARGKSAEPKLGTDVVAGARLLKWRDGTGMNRFAITDVNGFSTLGGTHLSDQYNFFVTYRGTIKHPGGSLQIRELDDVVEDGLWVFLDKKIGSNNTNDIFLEVHGFIWKDLTPDDPSINLPAGDIPIEIITVRCAKQISDMDVQIRLGGGGYQLVGDAPSTPEISPSLFPPAL